MSRPGFAASSDGFSRIKIMPFLFTSLSILLAVVVGGSVLYLLTVLAAAAVSKARPVNGQSGASLVHALPRFTVLIPAHNEEMVIRSTLHSLARQEYDGALFEVVVVADNCSDDTACIAASAGARVLERWNDELVGKGHALNWAIDRLRDNRFQPDAFVIVDADTEVAPDFLTAMAERIAAMTDAHGYWALQGRYGVLNANAGWRAALMQSAFELINHVRPLGLDRLGLTVGLKGNGMAFSKTLLAVATWSGSLTEDIDFGLELCRNQRIRVMYVPEARVNAVMPSTARDAASQRSRWENGRLRLVRERALPLFVEGIRTRNRLLVDAAVDLMIPPMVELTTLMTIWALLVGTGYISAALPYASAWMDAVAVTSIGLFVYLVGGLAVAGAPASAYMSLVFAPFYAVWKLMLYASRRHRHQRGVWIRTSRAPEPTRGPSLKGRESTKASRRTVAQGKSK